MPNKIINKLKTSVPGFLKERQSFIIALLLACLFWFSTKLSQRLQYTLPLNIEYILPEGKSFKRIAPQTLNVTFDGLGWNLFFLKSRAKSKNVDILLQNLSNQVMSTEELKESLASQFGTGNITVSNITPSQLFIELETKSIRKIPVRLEKLYSIAQGFSSSSEFKLLPDSITIEGPKTKIDKISFWPTNLVELENLKDDINLEVDLKSNSDSLVLFSHNSINISLQVERATEKILEVPVFIPTSFADKIKIIPSKIELIFLTGLSQYDRISPSDFRIELPYYNLSRLKDTPNIELKITVSSDKASHIRLKPNTVEVFITE